MNPEDFDFDDFLENSNNEFNSKLEEYKEKTIAQAIEHNYEAIVEKGISEWHLRHMDEREISELNQTFEVMIDHFEQLEEYEKCAHLVKERTKIEEILKVRQDI
jgi:methionyl-tRNA synthetase